MKPLIRGLNDGLKSWCESRSAISIARNGGAELAIRAQVLDFLELETGTHAFTEGSGKRVDLVLRSRADDEAPAIAMVEFKHNLMHKHQLRYIQAAHDSAQEQLRRAWHPDESTCECFYVHFVIELQSDQQQAPLVHAHNAHVGAAYKRFLSKSALEDVRSDVHAALGGVPSYVYQLAHPQDQDGSFQVLLHCWIYKVPRTGKVRLVRE